MRTVATIAEVRAWRSDCVGRVGLVPTMGYLHRGHRSLLERARAENDHVAATLFVNPTQFAPTDDLTRYPRDLEGDTRLLESVGCDLLVAPPPAEVYAPGFDTFVDVGAVAGPLEGAHRPGHFRGVATVVLKLLNIVQPHRAYFGRKDAQQLGVIRRMVRDLDMPVEIVGCPTVRESDGLALSSRNSYLGPEDRAAATVLSRALRAAEALWSAGERDAETLRRSMRAVLAAEARARPDYVSVADPDTFVELDRVLGRALLSMAVRVGPARLIDNVILGD
jgi:pantoate--beta-alanine ligase